MTDVNAARCWAEIDLDALRHNARVAHDRAGAGVELMAVVKANGYGHGAVQVAQALRDEAQLFGVANLAEAVELRNGGVTGPIVVLGPALPAERAAIVQHGFIPSVSSCAEAAAFDALAVEHPIEIVFVVDTGMGRMGTWQDEAVLEFESIARLERLTIHSVSTHLPAADEDAMFTKAELKRFDSLVQVLRARFPGTYGVHVLLSAGILSFAEHRHEIVRAGLMFYGASPLPPFQELLRPVMTLKARVALIRDVPAGRTISYGRTFVTERPMRVATLSVGYADGFPRAVSNRGAAVLIGGSRCSVLGRVTMDLIMVDVTNLPNIAPGDEAVLIGRQGNAEIPVAEVAERANTIAWEIFTGIGTRVQRVYV